MLADLLRADFLEEAGLRDAARALAVLVAGAGGIFLFNVSLARYLGPEQTGVFFLAAAIVGIGATISRLGIDVAALRYSAIAYHDRQYASLQSLFRLSMKIVAGVSLGAALVLLLCRHLAFLERHQPLDRILPVMLIAVPASALLGIQAELFKGAGRPLLGTACQVAVFPVLLLVGLAIVIASHAPTLPDAAALFAGTACAALCLAILAWQRLIPRGPGSAAMVDAGTLLKTSFPMLGMACIYLVLGWTDLIALAIWRESATIGVYGAASRVATLVPFVLAAVNNVVAPRFAAYHASGQQEALTRVATSAAALTAAATAPLILILLAFPGQVLQLFGSQFSEGAAIVRVLVAGQAINIATGSVGYLLMMTGHERVIRDTTVCAAVANLIMTFMLVPSYGAMGAAFSTALSLVLINAVAFYIVRTRLKINTLSYLSGMSRLVTRSLACIRSGGA